MKRQGEIDRELSDVDDKLGEMMEMCVEVIATLKPDLGSSRIEQMVQQGLLGR